MALVFEPAENAEGDRGDDHLSGGQNYGTHRGQEHLVGHSRDIYIKTRCQSTTHICYKLQLQCSI
jgi:hypothetical protein